MSDNHHSSLLRPSFTSPVIDTLESINDEEQIQRCNYRETVQCKLEEGHSRVHRFGPPEGPLYGVLIDDKDSRRILDVLLSVLNSEQYPINDLTQSHIMSIVSKLDEQLNTGWVGEAYTVWMEGTGP